ncbi:hypothetical protein Heshes_08490 [Alicyclobacillus hesperidum]|uniref:Uncharacterized protein n=1 Tax=Alicyclobacillus hesperidum TaxID=89784 RepID=A0AA37TWW8_9BACL|nr:hypothetical protein Heshes_08490 [Alicyclobacillus hesperidum]
MAIDLAPVLTSDHVNQHLYSGLALPFYAGIELNMQVHGHLMKGYQPSFVTLGTRRARLFLDPKR